jgi:hypothetical protein
MGLARRTLVAVLPLVVACQIVGGFDDYQLVDVDVGDGRDVKNAPDGTQEGDALVDAIAPLDGPDPDGGGTVYHPLGTSALWSTFDLAAVNVDANNFQGGAFDGRYVYFVPQKNVAARYDTQGPFATAGSWSAFDLAGVNAGAKGFVGGAFDGRYIYYVPSNNGAPSGLVTRYDTQAPFALAASWTTFNTTTVNAAAKGFSGAAFDGRYLYLVPATNGLVTRYDTQAAFGTGASWSTFDATTVTAGAKGFFGAAYDGHYVYFVPGFNTVVHGVVTRYDAQAAFTTGASWSTFDVSTVDPGAKGFIGAGFDGRYVYLVPNQNGAADGIVARYDNTAVFGAAASWSTFDVTTLNASAKGFFGAAFDGRNVFLIPSFNGTAFHGMITRFEGQGPFTASTSWSSFDVATVNALAKGFGGSVFDGRYVYLVPGAGSTVARFDARTPPSLPVRSGASFL